MPKRLRALAAGLCLCAPLFAALSVFSAGAALAAGDDVKLSLCKQVLARMFCKKPSEFGYTGKLEEGVYILSVFYASKNSEFLCAVMPDGQVIVQDRTWRAMRRVVPFSMSPDGKCLVAEVASQDCPNRAPVKACVPKGPQDAQEKLKETFWSRPIPKILEEEYRAMTARDQQNASVPAEQPAQPDAKAGK